jgi:probable rRNA maturation factor
VVIIANYNRIVKYFPKYIQKRLPKEVAVISISAKESRRLNRLYRKKDKPTNVLSFRYDSEYGEILVCPEVIKKEAKSAGNSLKYQMTWMIAHGMLHLGGVHHERGGAQEKKFMRMEVQILNMASKGSMQTKN